MNLDERYAEIDARLIRLERLVLTPAGRSSKKTKRKKKITIRRRLDAL